jgi:hypothetical protein
MSGKGSHPPKLVNNFSKIARHCLPTFNGKNAFSCSNLSTYQNDGSEDPRCRHFT